MTLADLMPLSPRQRDTLVVIQRFIAERGFPPTNREMGFILGINGSGAAVEDHLFRLEKKGYIKREPGKSRGIRVLHGIDDACVLGVTPGERKTMSRCDCGAVRFSPRCPPYIHEMMLKAERNDAPCPG